MNNKLNPIFLSIDNLVNSKEKILNIFNFVNKNEYFLESKQDYEKRAKTRYLFEKLTGNRNWWILDDTIWAYLRAKVLEGGLLFAGFLAFAPVVWILKPLIIVWVLGFFYLFFRFISFVYNFIKNYLGSLNMTNEEKVLYSSYAYSSGDSLKYSTNFEYFENSESLMDHINLLKENLKKFEDYTLNIEIYNKSLISSWVSQEKYLLNPLSNIFIEERKSIQPNYNQFDFVSTLDQLKEFADYFSLINFSQETFSKSDYKNFLQLINIVSQLNSYFKETFDKVVKEQPSYDIVFNDKNLELKITKLKQEQVELKNTLLELDSFIKINKNNKLVLNKLSELQDRINHSNFNLMLLTKTGESSNFKKELELNNLTEAKENINEMNKKLIELAELQNEVNTLLRKRVSDPLNYVKSGEALKTMEV